MCSTCTKRVNRNYYYYILLIVTTCVTKIESLEYVSGLFLTTVPTNFQRNKKRQRLMYEFAPGALLVVRRYSHFGGPGVVVRPPRPLSPLHDPRLHLLVGTVNPASARQDKQVRRTSDTARWITLSAILYIISDLGKGWLNYQRFWAKDEIVKFPCHFGQSLVKISAILGEKGLVKLPEILGSKGWLNSQPFWAKFWRNYQSFWARFDEIISHFGQGLVE